MRSGIEIDGAPESEIAGCCVVDRRACIDDVTTLRIDDRNDDRWERALDLAEPLQAIGCDRRRTAFARATRELALRVEKSALLPLALALFVRLRARVRG